MFLKYTKAKIQAVLHCLFHGVTLQHIRIFIFQKKKKKKKNHYRLFEDVGEQSVKHRRVSRHGPDQTIPRGKA